MSSYEERLARAMKYLGWEMRPFGFWPATDSMNQGLRRFLLACHACFNALYFGLLMSAQICVMCTTKEMTRFTQAASTLDGMTVVYAKYVMFFINQARLHEPIKQLVREEYEESMDIVRSLRRDHLVAEMAHLKDAVLASREAPLKEFELMGFIYFLLSTGTILQLLLSPLLLMIYNYYTNPDLHSRYLPADVPSGLYVTPYYQLIYIAELYALIMAWPGTHGTDMTFVAVMMMMIRQFTIIRIILKDLDKYAKGIYDHKRFEAIGLASTDDSATLEVVYYRILSQCIEHYARLMKLKDVINDAMGPIFLAQTLASSFGICVTLFNIHSADAERMDVLLLNVVFCVAYIMQIFLYCWYGQQMTNEAASVGEDAYQLNWPNRPKPFGDALRLLINENAKPLYLNAMGLVDLTLPKFQAILRAAMSYFTLLRSFSDEE